MKISNFKRISADMSFGSIPHQEAKCLNFSILMSLPKPYHCLEIQVVSVHLGSRTLER
ncbi:MAG TPA: hypothetical protein V6D14_27090 [Coleofasciculaceae cyanobacterium]